MDKKNQKLDSLIRQSNNHLLDNNDDCQQYLLQIIFLVKRIKTILIDTKNNNIIIDQLVQANMDNSYYFKLYHFLKACYQTKEIDFHHFSDLASYL